MIKFFKLYEKYENVEYRLANDSDIPGINKVARSLRNELGFVMNVVLKDAINHDELFVADLDGHIVGFVHFHRRRDGWNTIHEIGVLREYHDFGIGKTLFELVPKPRRLKTTIDNDKANEFYKRRGMNLIGREKGKKREINVWADVRESFNEMDPYNEERWDDETIPKKGDLVEVLPTLRIYINRKHLPEKLGLTIGRVGEVINNENVIFKGGEYRWIHRNILPEYTNFIAFLLPVDCLKVIKSANESFNELDPYDEEDWNDENEIKKGDILTCIDSMDSRELEEDENYKVTATSGDWVWVEGKTNAWHKRRFKKIKKFERFDIDPYGEENWDDKYFEVGDTVRILPKIKYYIDNYDLHKKLEFAIGRTGEVLRPLSHYDGMPYYVISHEICPELYRKDGDSETLGYTIPPDCLELVKGVNENIHSDIDPYGEENWNDPQIEETIITPKLDDQRQDSFWYYNNDIAMFKKGYNIVRVFCVGDIRLTFDDSGKIYENEDAIKEALRRDWTDRDLDDCNTWINNNWFEIEVHGQIDQDVEYLYDNVINQARQIIEQL